MNRYASELPSVIERLSNLVPWLNGDSGPAEARRRVGDFLEVSDRDPLCRTHAGAGRTTLKTLNDAKLYRLRRVVVDTLWRADTSWDDPRAQGQTWPLLRVFRRLKLGIIRRDRVRPDKATSRQHRPAAWKAFDQPGAFTMLCEGAPEDLLLFLVMRALTLEGTASLTECPAPAPNQPTVKCGRWMVIGRQRGRPRQFCSEACRQRAFATERRDELRAGLSGSRRRKASK